MSNPGEEKDQHLRGGVKHDTNISLPNQQWSPLFFISPFTSSYFPVQRGQLCSNTQKETIKWWILGSRETASLESTVCFINLKWFGTESSLHFLHWTPLLEQMCQDSATPPAPLQPQPHFIHLLPFFAETRVMQSQIIHYTLATLSQVERDRNTGKAEQRSKPCCSPRENSCTWHSHPLSPAAELCCSTGNSRGHRQEGAAV